MPPTSARCPCTPPTIPSPTFGDGEPITIWSGARRTGFAGSARSATTCPSSACGLRWATGTPQTVPGTTILRAPEPLCELLLERLPGRVAIEETPGQWEYLYTQEALSTLAGNKLHKKKNHVNGYMKAYGEDYRTLNGEIMPQVLALQDDWCKWRECEKSASLLAESDVVCSVLRNWDALPGLIGGTLYAGEEMAAFAVGEPLDDQTIVVHFEKGRPEYRGVYQAINFCFAKYAAKNFVFINREQDADEEGLRQAKESYMPSGYLKKNTIRIIA